MLKELSIIFMLLIFKVHAQCVISREYLKTSNHVFTIKTNNGFEMLRTNEVPVGTELSIFCSPTNNPFETKCKRHQATMPSSKRFKADNGVAVFDRGLPIQNCDGNTNAACDPEKDVFDPELTENKNTKMGWKSTQMAIEDASCPKPAMMFLVGYKLNKNQFLEVYRTCYNQSSQTALFSIHEIEPRSATATRSGEWTKPKVVVTGQVFKAEEIWKTFKNLFGDKQTYVPEYKTDNPKYTFVRGHLAPSADFVFCSQMKASYKLFNIVPQYEKVNNGNWLNVVENWVRASTILYGKLKVCTGGLGVLQLKHSTAPTMIDVYLGTNKRTPIPKWTYKIIKSYTNQQFHFAVITLNNAENPDVNIRPLCALKSSTYCRGLKINNNDPKKGLTFCCSADDFIRNNVPYLYGVC